MSATLPQGLFAALGGAKFIWFVVSGACVLALVAQSAALLTLWRRPSRLRKLGLVSLGAASQMAWVMSLPVISVPPAGSYAYNTVRIVNVCYFDIHEPYISNCSASASVAGHRSAALVIALSLLAIVGLTSACVVWAFKLKAREPRPPLGTVWLALVRLLSAFIGALVFAFGAALVVIGVLVIIDYWVNSRLYEAVDAELVGISFFVGRLGVIAGAIAAGVGALVLWLAGLRSRATMSTQST